MAKFRMNCMPAVQKRKECDSATDSTGRVEMTADCLQLFIFVLRQLFIFIWQQVKRNGCVANAKQNSVLRTASIKKRLKIVIK